MNKLKCEKCDKVFSKKDWLYCPFCGSDLIPYIEYTKLQTGILKQLERSYPEHLILYRSGYFYTAWHESAIALSLMFGYKLKKSSKNGYVTTGFPYSSLENKIQQLNEFNIDYVVECKSEILYEHHNGTSLSDFISQYNKHVL